MSIKNIEETWEQENNNALFKTFNQYLKKTTKLNKYGIELYISPECNQACEYCYLIKNRNKLYPQEIADHNLILKNLDIFFNYLIEKNYFPTSIDLFSGEIWNSPFGMAVLEKLLNFVKIADGKVKSIMIPSNFSFILDDYYKEKVEQIIEAAKYYGTSLLLSCSYDGPIVEEKNRPFVKDDSAKKTTDEYISRLFDWCKKFNFGFHPMVNAHNIDKWPDQFKWWVDTLNKYDLNIWAYSMFLEVRNNEWTEDTIKKYLYYLNESIDYTIDKIYKNDLNAYKDEIFCLNPQNNGELKNYNFQALGANPINCGCSVDHLISIRLGDLAWVPCHRTSYEKLIYGKLIVEDNKIQGIKALNLPLMISVNSLGYKGLVKCNSCPIANYCMRGCYGANFEYSKEMFYPCPTVCDLLTAKLIFLLTKWEKMYFEKDINIDSRVKAVFNDIKNNINNLPKETIDKWTKISTNIILSN